MTMRTPCFLSWRTTSRVEALIGSARARLPAYLPSTATARFVPPMAFAGVWGRSKAPTSAINASGTSIPPALRYSIFAFLLVVLTNNLGFRIAGHDPEPLGFLVLIGGLAYTAAQRAISREQKLAAVESELATARRIQTSILPRALPTLPGLRLAASYRPMTAVAGDFYDFLPLDQGRVTVLVADVSGHGVPAALIASMLKVAFALQ